MSTKKVAPMPSPMAGLSGSSPGPNSAPGALTSGVGTRAMRPMVRSNTKNLKRAQSARNVEQVKKNVAEKKKKKKKKKDSDGEDVESDDDHMVETSSLYSKVGISKSEDGIKARFSSSRSIKSVEATRKYSMVEDEETVAEAEKGKIKKKAEPKIHLATSKKGIVIQTIDFAEIVFLNKIGTGSTAEVHKVRWIGNVFAAKKYMTDVEGGLDKAKARMERETAVHSSLPRHANIMTFQGSCPGDNPCILTELIIGATLQTVLRKYDDKPEGKNPWPADRQLVYPWMVDLMRGLAFLQDRAQVVVHRDLNPSNLMLSEGMKKLKIFDFGLSKTCPRDQLISHKFPQKDDVYNCALIMWEMSTGFLPPGGYHIHLDPIYADDERRPDLSAVKWPEVRQIIDSSWRADKDLRFEASEVLQELEHLADVDPTLVAGRDDMKKGGMLSKMFGKKKGKCSIL